MKPAIRSVETNTSLLLTWESETSVYVNIDKAVDAILNPNKKSLTEEKSIKFDIIDGVLYVTHYSSNDDTENHNVLKEFIPQLGGLLLYYLQVEGVSEFVETFIDKHFPAMEYNPMNEAEECDASEIFRHDDKITEPQRKIVDLALKIISLSFPVFSTFLSSRLSDGFYGLNFFDSNPRSYYHAKNYRELVTAVFGVYRKDLMKAVNVIPKKNLPELLSWSENFKDILGIDSFVDALRTTPFHPSSDERLIDTSSLSRFPRSTIKRLFVDGFNSSVDFTTITDALEMSHYIPDDRVKECNTWKKLHDQGLINYTYDGEILPVHHNDAFESFFSQGNVEKLTINPLRETTDFLVTGQTMLVCVGTRPYVHRALNGTGYCFRLDKNDDVPYALVEVRQKNNKQAWYISQLRGVKNADVDLSLRDTIYNQLEQFMTMERGNYA